ncbi:unnamed protein product [Arabidopsis arenosa]|uniref:Peptidase A1 domain-containing protein n=1 Tax=Arabidopsis arenosa TaxID=38785 RepID=A0A8S1ZM49_ARAAE|nr:unnamed protein product [Arabidopsis arenosa]
MASLISATLLSLLLLSNVNAYPKHGFTLELIHRDSPKSPFYNPGETSSQRMRNAVRRSARSTLEFSNDDASTNSPQSVITSNHGEYLMNISIGTPPFPILAIADTGSDLIWTQCNPCKDCYNQKAPLFDPKQSSTYKKVSCSSSHCRALEEASCSTDKDTCSYTISYGDNSYTKGDVAVDTLTIGSSRLRPVSLRNVIIGCGHDNTGIFDAAGSGIIGLGGGSTSLVSQLGKSNNVASTIKVERVHDPNRVLSLCYRDTSSFKVPDITVHFKGGDVKLHKVNTFVEVSEDVSCFAFAENEQLTIYGNLAQMNFLVGYDTVSGTVSFKRTDCAQM